MVFDSIQEEEKFVSSIFRRFKKREFKGTEGQVIKNSTYHLARTLIAKVGSLIFTILIARMLLPELFGLYTLAISTILIFTAFSDLGIGPAVETFLSRTLGEGKETKAKAYFRILLKYKFVLVSITSLILIGSSYFISNTYYHKPIFFALITGTLYLIAVSFLSFIESTFKATNNFKYPFYKEMIFQVLRLAIIPLAILFLMKYSFSNQTIVAAIIFVLSISYFLSLLFLFIFSRKQMPFLNTLKIALTKKEKSKLKIFIFPLAATVLSGVFFGYIDTIMLGRFVSGEFIGYYGSSFSLIGSASVILGFVGGGLLPIFSRLKGNSLERAFRKTAIFTFLISFVGATITFLFSSLIIKIVYGASYLPSVLLLKLFSILLIIFPLTAIYDCYFIS